MKQRDSYIVYHRKLYTHGLKNYKEPSQNEKSFPKMPNQSQSGTAWAERTSFVVEWEVNKPELTHTGQTPSKDDSLSFIIDW